VLAVRQLLEVDGVRLATKFTVMPICASMATMAWQIASSLM
jgi:hypothetical protein